MNHYWRFAKLMLADRRTVILAVLFACISSLGLGVALVSLGPMLELILSDESGKSLVQLAREFNSEGRWIQVPQWIVDQLPDDRFQGVLVIVGALILLSLVGATSNFMHQYLSGSLTVKAIARIRRDAFEHVIHMPLGHVVVRGASEFVARIIRDTAELQRGLLALVSKSVTQIAKGIGAFCAALYFSWALTLIAIICAPLLVVVLRKIGKRVRRGVRGSLRAQEKLLAVSSESIRGLRAVKSNTGEDSSVRVFDAINEDVIREDLRVRTARAASAPLVESIALYTIAALALIAAKQIIDGNLEFDRFLLTLGALGISGASFRPLAGLITEMQGAAAPAQRLAEVLDEPNELAGESNCPQLPPHHRSITFQHVSVTYEAADAPALNAVSLNIEHGENIALVGPNGSGKTTLISLLPRLLTPDTGRVLIDDVDIAMVNLKGLRRQIGVVTQDTVLFAGSIAQNIAFGMDNALLADIEAAATKAHAMDFIRKLPRGLDTDLAEQGATLSGGQRQRIAIARAILRSPKILILDEATSQIDAESESHITQALAEFGEGRTVIAVAHRLSTVRNADRIVVMDKGSIVDQGTHDELLECCDLYRRLTHTQLQSAS